MNKKTINIPNKMIPSAEGDQIYSNDGNPLVLESQCVSDAYIDVNVVPEHEKNQLEHSILNLQGTYTLFFVLLLHCFILFVGV